MASRQAFNAVRLALALAVLGACGESPFDYAGPGIGPGDDDTGGADDDTTEAPFDCTQIPPLPKEHVFHDSILASEDFTFDDEGHMVHVSVGDGGFRRTDYDGTTELILPNISGWPRGTRMLLDGDVVVANPDLASLQRLSFAGAKSALGPSINDPNGVAIRDDGTIFVTNGMGELWRVEPDTGTGEPILQQGFSLDGIVFDGDFDALYVDNEMGVVHRIPLDEAGEPGAAEEFATIDLSVEMDLLDGMTMDVCGNLYVICMSGRVMRVTSAGEVEEFYVVAPDGMTAIAALNFGTGVGGWEEDHLFVSSLDHGLYEVEVGIPGRREPFWDR